MTREINNPITFEDLIFEHRNKEYGAYLLRKLYDRTVLVSLILSSIIFTLLLLLPLIQSSTVEKVITNPPVKARSEGTVLINIGEKHPPLTASKQSVNPSSIKPSKIKPVTIKSSKLTPMEIVDDSKVNETPNDEQNNEVESGNENAVATKYSLPFLEGDSNSIGNGLGIGEVDTDPIWRPDAVEKYPTFPGFAEYVNSKLSNRLSSYLQERSIKGLMYVTMIVGKDGSVTDVKLLKGIADCKICNEDIPQIIKDMPNWGPAEFNGYPVKVRINVPIQF